jgi:alkylation response protein AidB-like acyl-CoA dehydrogenase
MLSEDQEAIRQVVTEFAQAELAPHAVEWDRAKHFPVDVLRKGAELGLGAIYVSEEHGGAGLSRADAVVIIEALATGCPSIASYFSIHNMVAAVVDRYGTDEQRAHYLPDLCSMAKLASYCLTEPSAGSDAAALVTKATAGPDGYMLNGVKQFISGAGTSGTYIVFARTGSAGPHGISAFLVDKGTPGLSFGANEVKMGWNAQPTRQVILENVHVPSNRLLGEDGGGFSIAMAALDGGRLNIAASSLGGGSAALDKAIAYLSDRDAFGSKLITLQALQFQIADMRTRLEAARALLMNAARALDAKDPEATVLCAMAKMFGTDAGHAVADQALQLLGGYGYLSEYGVEKIVRDLRVHRILEGTNEVMRHIVARKTLKGAS